MAAPKGNQFWKARTKHGRDKLFSSPEALWESCCEYFQWAEDNPLIEYKVTQYQGEVITMPVPKLRALTKAGLCYYLKVDETTLNRYKEDQDFYSVIHEAEQVIYQQKFSGAAADLLNSNIIARDLGLAEKQMTDVTSKGQALNTWIVNPVTTKKDA